MFNLHMCNGLDILQVHLEKQLCNFRCFTFCVSHKEFGLVFGANVCFLCECLPQAA